MATFIIFLAILVGLSLCLVCAVTWIICACLNVTFTFLTGFGVWLIVAFIVTAFNIIKKPLC